MSLPDIQSWDEAVSVGIDCLQAESDSAWTLGDLANLIAKIRPNDKYLRGKTSTLKKFAGELNISYSSLRKYALTSMHVESGLRTSLPTMTHGHWREIIGRGHRGSEAIEWAMKADEERWAVTRLRRELRSGVDVPHAVRWLKSMAATARRIGYEDVDACFRADPEDVSGEVEDIQQVLGWFCELNPPG
jgi:hypothetical protein